MPQNDVEVARFGTGREAAHKQSVIVRPDQPSGKGLRVCLSRRFHLVSPTWVGQSSLVHALRAKCDIIAAIEQALDGRFVANQGRWLKIADLIGFPDRGHDGWGEIQGRYASGIETPAVESCTLSRQRLTRVNGVQRPVELSSICDGHGSGVYAGIDRIDVVEHVPGAPRAHELHRGLARET